MVLQAEVTLDLFPEAGFPAVDVQLVGT
jgi:hypothetical protein